MHIQVANVFSATALVQPIERPMPIELQITTENKQAYVALGTEVHNFLRANIRITTIYKIGEKSNRSSRVKKTAGIRFLPNLVNFEADS